MIESKCSFELLTSVIVCIVLVFCCKSNSKKKKKTTMNSNKKKVVNPPGAANAETKQKTATPAPAEQEKNKKKKSERSVKEEARGAAGPNKPAKDSASKLKSVVKEEKKEEVDDKKEPNSNLPIESARSVHLDPKNLPPLEDTVIDDHSTPVHERAQKIANDKLIIDPKYTQYGGNIDLANEKEKDVKIIKFTEDLDKVDKESFKEMTSKRVLKQNIRVKLKEEKCVLFETNDVPTDDDEEEAANDG